MKKQSIRIILKSKTSIVITLLSLIFSSCTPLMPDFMLRRQNNADYDQCMLNDIVVPCHPLTLTEVVEFALTNNLDVQLQQLERRIHDKNYIAQKLEQLPSLTIEGELARRSNTPAWFSKPKGGEIGPVPTISSEKTRRYIDITAAFNVLDFGLSYIKTRQEKNRALMVQQRHLRARQNLILDIYRAYWRAIVAKEALEKASQLVDVLEDRLVSLHSQVEEQIISELRGLLTKNRILDTKLRLSVFENDYRSAKTELAALMGLVPGTCFELADVEIIEPKPFDIDPCLLERQALLYRPELMVQEMQYAIDVDEVRASIINFFPNLELFKSLVYDGDRFQLHNDWTRVGASVTWDLLTLPSKKYTTDANIIQRDLSWHTRLSMSMGILTQVHLALINVKELEDKRTLSNSLYEVKQRQLEVAKLLDLRGQIDIDEVIEFEAEALFAEVQALKEYANLQVALEQLGNAVGRPLELTQKNFRCFDRFAITEPFIVENCYDIDDCGNEYLPIYEEQNNYSVNEMETSITQNQTELSQRDDRKNRILKKLSLKTNQH